MEVPIQTAKKLLEEAWARHTERPNAKFIADVTMKSALRKDDRMNVIAGCVEDLRKFKERGRPKIEVTKVGPSLARIDMNASPGIACLREISSSMMKEAKKHGVSIRLLRNSGGVHELSTWMEPFVSSGFVSLFMWNGGSYTVVPHGSREPFFGTNPIAYGIPTTSEPIICDMATSEAPYLTLNHARKHKQQLRDGVGLDADGKPTNDPFEVYNPKRDDFVRLLPMGGGAKGSALMLLVEVLTGALAGGKMGRAATDDPWIPEEFGGLLMCFAPQAATGAGNLPKLVSRLANDIRKSPARPGFSSVSLPGDSELARYQTRLEKGSVEIDKDTRHLLEVV